jgi:hypothetical protein
MILEFKNHVFKEGINVTVRRGLKWANEKMAQIQLDENNVTRPIMIKTSVVKFQDLLDVDLQNEHDPECRTVIGLQKIMANIYQGFDPREIVTIVEWDHDSI